MLAVPAMTALDRRRMLMLAPLGIAAAGGAAFWTMLDRMRTGAFDPHGVPSPLVGHAVPPFDLPPQPLLDGSPGEGFTSADLAAPARPILLNFFASWCIPCVQEAPLLTQLAKSGMPIWGVTYKDRLEASTDFLRHNGNPYARVARDATGRAAIDWGLTGVPESFVVDRAGIVHWHWAGPLDPDIVRQQLLPLLRRLG